MYLNREEQEEINARVARVELKTGAQVVAAIVDKSDTYPEVPWKAFALGASIAALALSAWVLAGTAWRDEGTVLLAALAIAVAGGACALLSVAFPALAALFVDDARRDMEVRQYAQALFLERELYATRGRIGVLMLVSLLEREVVLLPDTGVSIRVSRQEFARIIAHMKPALRRRRLATAVLAGLDELERLLLDKGFVRRSSLQNELPDAIIQTRGPQ